MGQIRTGDCERMDAEMARLFPGFVGGETGKDEYAEDFIVRVSVNEELHLIRVTLDEYRDGDWVENIRLALEALSAD